MASRRGNALSNTANNSKRKQQNIKILINHINLAGFRKENKVCFKCMASNRNILFEAGLLWLHGENTYFFRFDSLIKLPYPIFSITFRTFFHFLQNFTAWSVSTNRSIFESDARSHCCVVLSAIHQCINIVGRKNFSFQTTSLRISNKMKRVLINVPRNIIWDASQIYSQPVQGHSSSISIYEIY